ncbi:MAG TPA: hypothetical protein VM144_09865 [Aestuariivirga sp.]|nr:hypothetical protein [Aestuariivirga sp.]
MTHALDRRLARLEDQQPSENRPYAIMPEHCNTMQEWLARVESVAAGQGHYELEPMPIKGYVRRQYWIADPAPEDITSP